MGKVVKYCTVCEESFAEKFSFCPNCAAKLNAYEMNPLVSEAKTEESVKVFAPAETFSAPVTVELPKQETIEFRYEPETPAILSNANSESNDEILEINEEKIEEPIVTAPLITAPLITAPAITIPAAASYREEVIEEPIETTPPIPEVAFPVEEAQKIYIPASIPVYQQTTASFADETRSTNKKLGNDGFYSVTLVEEKDSGTRRFLLMGAFLLVMGGALLSVVASIYNADAFVGALDDKLNSIVFVNDEPTEIEPEEPKEIKKVDKDAGGGGGGNKDPNPVSKGKLADELKNPDVPPSVKLHQMKDPELVQNVGVKSDQDKIRPPSDEKYGNPNAKYDTASDGPGSDGGQGAGRNKGQGDGDGPGFNNGTGGGPGGTGPGGRGSRRPPNADDDEGNPPPEIKKPPVGPTEAMKILAKPRANYTDAARQNQVQGTVTLRVTFLANGSIGSIAPISGLPNGLTEQAIAAARSIRFEPAKKNGVAQTVTKQVQYSFTLY